MRQRHILRSKRALMMTALLLAALLLGAGVYAAASQSLHFSGRATLHAIDATEVHFVVAKAEAVAPGGSTGYLSLEPGDGKMNQVARITATFEDVSDVLRFEFRLENVGTYPAVVTGADVGREMGGAGRLSGSYGRAAGLAIGPGEIYPASDQPPYTIILDFRDVDTDSIEIGRPYYFDISLPYERTP